MQKTITGKYDILQLWHIQNAITQNSTRLDLVVISPHRLNLSRQQCIGLSSSQGYFTVEVNGNGTLGPLYYAAYTSCNAGAYLLEFTGCDVFDDVGHDGSVLGFKFTHFLQIL